MTTTTKTVAYIGGGFVLLAWLASAAGVPPPPRDPVRPSRPSDEVSLQQIAADVQSQSARLRQRLAAAPVPQTPLRNPFSFDTRDAARPRPVPRTPAPVGTTLVETLIAEPGLSLIGMAENSTPAGLVRTAMIAGPAGALFMAVAGDEVADRYTVSAVAADSVELKDRLTGATRRLSLR